MLANCYPALTTVQPSLEKVDLSGALTAHSEALDVSIPCQASLFERIDRSLSYSDGPAHSSLKQKHEAVATI